MKNLNKKLLNIIVLIILINFNYLNADPILHVDDWDILKLKPIKSSDIKIKDNTLKYKSKTIKLETINNIEVHALKNNLFVYEIDNKILNILNLKNKKIEKIKWEYGEPKAVLSNKCDFIREWLTLVKAEKELDEINYFILSKFPYTDRAKKSKASYFIGGGRIEVVYTEEQGFIGENGFKGPDKALYNDKHIFFGDIYAIENIKNCEFGNYFRN